MTANDRKWRFQSRKTEFEKVTPLWLYPELDCSACVDDADDRTGAGQLAYYVDYVRNRHPEWWEADAVGIYWGVYGDNVAEHAPSNPIADRSFLTVYRAGRRQDRRAAELVAPAGS